MLVIDFTGAGLVAALIIRLAMIGSGFWLVAWYLGVGSAKLRGWSNVSKFQYIFGGLYWNVYGLLFVVRSMFAVVAMLSLLTFNVTRRIAQLRFNDYLSSFMWSVMKYEHRSVIAEVRREYTEMVNNLNGTIKGLNKQVHKMENRLEAFRSFVAMQQTYNLTVNQLHEYLDDMTNGKQRQIKMPKAQRQSKQQRRQSPQRLVPNNQVWDNSFLQDNTTQDDWQQGWQQDWQQESTDQFETQELQQVVH